MKTKYMFNIVNFVNETLGTEGVKLVGLMIMHKRVLDHVFDK